MTIFGQAEPSQGCQVRKDAVNQVGLHKAMEFLKSRLKWRTIAAHFLAWELVGMVFGWLSATTPAAGAMVAFIIAGGIIGAVLSVLTYPLAYHHHMILIGSCMGLAVGGVIATVYPSNLALCLMIGALIGGTCLFWIAPLNCVLANLTRRQQTGTSV